MGWVGLIWIWLNVRLKITIVLDLLEPIKSGLLGKDLRIGFTFVKLRGWGGEFV